VHTLNLHQAPSQQSWTCDPIYMPQSGWVPISVPASPAPHELLRREVYDYSTCENKSTTVSSRWLLDVVIIKSSSSRTLCDRINRCWAVMCVLEITFSRLYEINVFDLSIMPVNWNLWNQTYLGFQNWFCRNHFFFLCRKCVWLESNPHPRCTMQLHGVFFPWGGMLMTKGQT
jgi:hypothetical protein